MSLGFYSAFAGIMSLVGLLAFAPEQVQQSRLKETQTSFIGISESPSPEASGTPAQSADSQPKDVEIAGNRVLATERPITGAPSVVPTVVLPALIAPLTSANQKQLTLLDKAYLDAYIILREDNSCSRFYGGPAVIEALNTLTLQLTPRYLDRSIALRMKGTTMSSKNFTSGLSYRIFEKAELNINGPFYQSGLLPNAFKILSIGEFAPNTREARVTILLHELGHLIRKPDLKWLLPDDGNDPSLSRENTTRVISACGDEIRRLVKSNFGDELMGAQAGIKSDSNGQFRRDVALTSTPGANTPTP